MTTTTMKAVQLLNNNKSRDTTTRVIQVPKPEPSPTQVLVKVHCSALDTATDAVLQKTFMGKFTHKATDPLILGWHYSGVVEQLGAADRTSSSSSSSSSSFLQVGDEVFGHLPYDPSTEQGTFSEYIVVSPEECARKPNSISHKVAAAATTESMTALQAMRTLGGLQKGQRVLIIGAGGGVGSVAISVAKRLGAMVTAVCSTRDVNRVKSLGADSVIDRSKNPNVWKHVGSSQKYNVIFDVPCVYSAIQASKYLQPKGTYVSPLPSVSLFVAKFFGVFTGKKSEFVMCHSVKKDLELVGEWLASGMVVEIDSSYKIQDLPAAMARQRIRTKKGRVVIQVEGGW